MLGAAAAPILLLLGKAATGSMPVDDDIDVGSSVKAENAGHFIFTLYYYPRTSGEGGLQKTCAFCVRIFGD
jgi:hypothetical protein